MGLNKKQRAFVEEYLQDFNATQAAIRAGYSERTAGSIGHRLLKNVEIAEAVQQRIDELAMTADEALLRLAEQARNEAAGYLNPDGTIRLRELIADDRQHLVKGSKWDRFGNLIVEFYDAQSALRTILDYHTRAASGRSDDPIHVRALDLDTLIERIYGSSDD